MRSASMDPSVQDSSQTEMSYIMSSVDQIKALNARIASASSANRFLRLLKLDTIELFTNINVPLDPLLSYEFCKLHDLEYVVKPQGIAKGYPTNIDFEKMAERVTALLPSLALFMKSDGGSHFLLAQKAFEGKHGARKAKSVMGQFAQYAGGLTGYYGPKGFSIINEILVKRYLDSDATLADTRFARNVLVPEVVVSLIQQDQNVGYEQAIDILRDSKDSGDRCHPFDGDSAALKSNKCL